MWAIPGFPHGCQLQSLQHHSCCYELNWIRLWASLTHTKNFSLIAIPHRSIFSKWNIIATTWSIMMTAFIGQCSPKSHLGMLSLHSRKCCLFILFNHRLCFVSTFLQCIWLWYNTSISLIFLQYLDWIELSNWKKK